VLGDASEKPTPQFGTPIAADDHEVIVAFL
jgi:hypothetical protein